MKYVGPVTSLGETEILIGKSDGRNYLGEAGVWEENSKVVFK
jgi:hypothetical protein